MLDPHIEVTQEALGCPVQFLINFVGNPKLDPRAGGQGASYYDVAMEMSEDCARDLINKIFDAMCDNAIAQGMSKFTTTPTGVK